MWGEHVGELELHVWGASEPELFVDAARALAELLDEEDAPSRGVTRTVGVEGADRALLFAAWLEELAFLAEVDGFVPERVEAIQLGAGRLRARVRGHRGSPPHLVKAVTHHRLAFAPEGDGWRAHAVLDV